MKNSFELFTTCVTRAYKNIQRIKKHEALTFGIMGFQVMCVYFLGKNQDGLTITELSALCCEDKAAVSRTVDSLSITGYVRWLDAEEPKRRWRAKITLTEKGRRVARGISKTADDIVKSVGEGFDEAQLLAFYKMFYVLNDRLKKYCDEMEQRKKS